MLALARAWELPWPDVGAHRGKTEVLLVLMLTCLLCLTQHAARIDTQPMHTHTCCSAAGMSPAPALQTATPAHCSKHHARHLLDELVGGEAGECWCVG